MRKKTPIIPINRLASEVETGIIIEEIAYKEGINSPEAKHSHRHDYHIFLVVKKGEIHVEIDFEEHILGADSIIYIHPSQIHRIVNLSASSSFYLLGISSENLGEVYLRLLEQLILPARPLKPDSAILEVLFSTIVLCQVIQKRKSDRLYGTLIKDYCNSFVGVIVSQYLEHQENAESLNRFEIITKEFRLLLEKKFTGMKKPSNYADALHISVAYLRECVRNTTGISISQHIQNRIVLEAKRLLYYSQKSIKEIANELGYEDHAYFSRFFKKNVGITAVEFRRKNT